MKSINVEGIVLRETKVGDSDKILTVFTKQLGKISVSVPNARGMKSKFTSAGVLSYSNYTLICVKSGYRLIECSGIHSFGQLAYDYELFTLCVYFAEIIAAGEQEGSPNELMLKLYLNTLYLLCEKRRQPRFIKAVFEMKAACVLGFAPDLSSCGHCGGGLREFFFSKKEGAFLCENCKTTQEKNREGVASAIEYIVNSPYNKIFSFKLSEDICDEFYRICEAYITHHLEYSPKSLKYLNF